MSTWSEGWEQTPSGSYKGSYTAQAITDMLYEFHVRMMAQHTWDATTSPKCSHPLSGFGVVDIVETGPYSRSRVGALQYNSILQQFWRDNGAALDGPIGGVDHGIFTLNMSATTAHSQYGLVTGAQTYTLLKFGRMRKYGYKIEGLPTSDSGYSDSYVIARGVHKGYSATSHAKHADDVITATIMNASGAKVGTDKLPFASATTVYSGTPGSGVLSNNAMPNLSFMPWLATPVDGALRIMPGFYASTTLFPASTTVLISLKKDGVDGTHTVLVRALS